MGAVVDLASRRPEPMLWRCECETISFYLHEDGRIECCGCKAIQNTTRGEWIVPEPTSVRVHQFPSVEPTD